jgi:hypothetical protein
MAEFILKDQYGKEKVFDHDKIFVQGTDGELVQFTEGTGDVPAVVQALEVTQNGTYTSPEGVDGFNQVTVNVPDPEITLQDKTVTENGTYTADSGYDGLGSVTVDVAGAGGGMERTTIFPEQTVTTSSSDYGNYDVDIKTTEKLVDACLYEVFYDGVAYICCPSFRAGKVGSLTLAPFGIGNHKLRTKAYTASITWYETNTPSEPFFILNSDSNNRLTLQVGTSGNHTLRIDKISVTA